MALFPIPDIIVWAKISQYLGRFYVAQNNLFSGGDIDPNYPQLIRMERRGLEFMYNFNPSDPNIDAVANYVYGLIKYLNQAKVIAGQGGSGGIVNPATGVASTITGMQLQFELGTTSSPKTVNGISVTLPIDGATSLTIPISNIVDNSIDFSVGGSQIPSEAANNAVYVQIVYSTNQVVITLIGFAFSTGNNYEINGLQYVPV